MNENVIEWINGQDRITVTFSQAKYINRVKRLAEKDKNIEIIAENKDGTLCAHLPLKYLKLSAPKQMSEEQKNVLRERLSHARAV